MRTCGAVFTIGEIVSGGKVIRPAMRKRCQLLVGHPGGHAAPRGGDVV